MVCCVSGSNDRDHKRDHKRERTKFRSVEKDLLLAFVYYDLTHTGYLLDKDVEEILHTIGLHLSRAQVSNAQCHSPLITQVLR